MSVWSQVVALSIGGALGVNARYWLGTWIEGRLGPGFPWSTFAINVSGSFVIGLLAVAFARLWPSASHARILILTGVLGGYTTFSTFAYESANLWGRGQLNAALGNLFGSVVAGFLAVVVGINLAQTLCPPERPLVLPDLPEDEPAAAHRAINNPGPGD